jgi:hypothetical protein
MGKQRRNAQTIGNFASFTVYHNLDSRIHHETGAGAFSLAFNFRRKRISAELDRPSPE